MQKLVILTFLTLTGNLIFSQSNSNNDVYLKLSGGDVSFGSGDFLGYSISIEASKNIIKKPSFPLDRLLLGGEIFYENGVKNPVVNNPAPAQFFTSFQHASSTILWAKSSYYPFKKIIPGFNIQMGPTMGYTYRSMEESVALTADVFGRYTRRSKLYFDNGFTYGFRISTGLEFMISKKLLTGLRMDLTNNNEWENNTMLGIKMGLKL